MQGAAGAVGALVMALLPKLFADKDGDGIPDIVQRGSMLLVLALAAGPVLVGCGAQLTASQREALAVETQRCVANERAIVDRPDTTEEQDRADLAAERSRCDAARTAIVGGE